jgi:hypothetical protein
MVETKRKGEAAFRAWLLVRGCGLKDFDFMIDQSNFTILK